MPFEMPRYRPPLPSKPYRVLYGPADGATYTSKGPPPPYIQWTGRDFELIPPASDPEDTSTVYILLGGWYIQYSMVEYEGARRQEGTS